MLRKLCNKLGMIAVGMIFMLFSFAVPAMALNPYAHADHTWITLSGEVKNVIADSFVLDFGSGSITVEMDDKDRDSEAYKLTPGDKVTVNGMIDDDFFEMTTIEASSVYVEKLGTYFFASAADEEDPYIEFVTPVIVSSITVQGTVTSVGEHEFKIDNDLRTVTVKVEKMSYNPLDDEGYQKIQVGDIVRARGVLDESFFEGNILVAETVIKLSD